MHDKMDKKTLDEINRLLLSIASGDLSARSDSVKLAHTDLDMASLLPRIKETVEKIDLFFRHSGFANIIENYNYEVRSFIMVGTDNTIVAMNPGLRKRLSFDEPLTGKPFSTILSVTSNLYWKRVKSKLYHKEGSSCGQVMELTLIDGCGTRTSMKWFLDGLGNGGHLILSNVVMERESDIRKRELARKVSGQGNGGRNTPAVALQKKYQTRLTRSDIQKITKAHDYLKGELDKDKLDESLPSIKAVANLYGLSVNRLKAGFWQIYGDSPQSLIYSRHLDKQMGKRLEIAMPLVKQTELSFREISIVSGFKHLSNFSTAVQAKYGKSAREIRKEAIEEKNRSRKKEK